MGHAPDVQHAQECADDWPYLDGRYLAKLQRRLQSREHVGSCSAILQGANLQHAFINIDLVEYPPLILCTIVAILS